MARIDTGRSAGVVVAHHLHTHGFMRPFGLVLATAVITMMMQGCAARVGYVAPAPSPGYGPDLVYVSPGVQVIADYDEPVFYSDNYYWRSSGGSWYRSRHHTGGWVMASPPVAVRRIERPGSYVHYRPSGWAGHRAPPPTAHERRTGFEPPRPAPGPPPRLNHPGPMMQARPAPPPPRGAPGRMRERHDARGIRR